MFLHFTLFLLILFFITGCSTRDNPTYKKRVTSTQTTTFINKTEFITTALYIEYEKWIGTPYKLGGKDFNGVDCSSFVQTVYKNAFNIKLPRTTKEQAKKGFRVNRNSSKAGDIILFKTAYNIRHSGIIIEKGKFMHTSEKHGVSISNIHNPYWNSKYWQTRRILP